MHSVGTKSGSQWTILDSIRRNGSGNDLCRTLVGQRLAYAVWWATRALYGSSWSLQFLECMLRAPLGTDTPACLQRGLVAHSPAYHGGYRDEDRPCAFYKCPFVYFVCLVRSRWNSRKWTGTSVSLFVVFPACAGFIALFYPRHRPLL